MRLTTLDIGCFGGGTGLPSLLGGLKRNPWLTVNAVVTMFDSGGSSGELRDELGVLPPGDVLKCALALARNEREARRVLLSRLPMLEHARLRGHTGGNLLLSMMERYSGDFLAAVDGLRALLGCAGACGRSASSRRACARSTATARGRAAKSRSTPAQTPATRVARLWLEPEVEHPSGGGAGDPRIRGGRDRPGQLLHEPDADLPGAGRAGGGRARCTARSCSSRNLLTEGRGMRRSPPPTPCACSARRSAGRSTSLLVNTARPSAATLDALRARAQGAARARRHARQLRARRRASSGAARSRATIGGAWRFAVWSILSRRLLDSPITV